MYSNFLHFPTFQLLVGVASGGCGHVGVWLCTRENYWKTTKQKGALEIVAMSDWNEVRRLQAELERVQSAASPFRLSEVNCVEIVKKLSEMKLISLLYTTDGKEYIVQEHLEKEIMNEIEANKG